MLKYSITRMVAPSPVKEKKRQQQVGGGSTEMLGNHHHQSPVHQINNNCLPNGHHLDNVNLYYQSRSPYLTMPHMDGQGPNGMVNHTALSLGEIIRIYTDWANHYLEKGQKKRVIVDLQKDMQDSVLLIDVVEAVTGEKVPDIKRKPKNAAQVVENIGSCLQYLSNLGVNVDGLTAKDIRDGQLKSILGLFFSLSRYKQQQKSALQQQHQQQQQHQHQNGSTTQAHQPSNSRHSSPYSQHQQNGGGSGSTGLVQPKAVVAVGSNDMLSRLPSPFKSAGGGATSAIPSATTTGISQTSSSGIPSLSSMKSQSSQSSSSPSDNNKKCSDTTVPESAPAPQPQLTSKLQAPTSSGLKAPSVHSKLPGSLNTSSSLSASTSSNGSVSKLPAASASSGLKPPTAKSSSLVGGTGGGGKLQQPSSVALANKDGKMLEKLKLFGKDKGQSNSKGSSVSSSSKSTTSTASSIRSSTCTTSSGFSSGKSELSDSMEAASTSSGGSSLVGGKTLASTVTNTNTKACSPKMSLKMTVKKSFASGKSTMSSPKSARKDSSKGSMAIKMENPSNSSGSSGSVQTSPMMSRKQSATSSNKPYDDVRSQMHSSDDADSAYAGGCDSSSPSSSIVQPCSGVPPPQKKTSGEKRPSLPSGSGLPSSTKLAIPKPTMAVKGTTKPVVPQRDESTRLESTSTMMPPAMAQQSAVTSSGLAKPSSLPKTNSRQKIAASTQPSNPISEQQPSSVDVVLDATVAAGSKSLRNGAGIKPPGGSSPSTSTAAANPMSPSGAVVVGVVSPITHHRKTNAAAMMVPSGGADLNSSLESTVGHQSDSNSSHTSGNQSDTASVIYCPSADEQIGVPPPSSRNGQQKSNRNPAVNRAIRSTRSPGSSSSNSANQLLITSSEQKLREMSGSPAGRTQSRLETTFDSNDGVTVTTTTNSGSDEDDSDRSKSQDPVVPMAEFLDSNGLVNAGAEEELASVEPMQPLLPRASPYAYLKNYANTVVPHQEGARGSVANKSMGAGGSKRLSGGCAIGVPEQVPQVSATSASSSTRAAMVRAKSPRLLLNKPLATLLHADSNGDPSSALEAIRQAGNAQSNDLVSAGYMSDGDALTLASVAAQQQALAAAAQQPHLHHQHPQMATAGGGGAGGAAGAYGDLDISGYMSEGGISLYARKMQARFREGLEAVRDSMRDRKSAASSAAACGNMANFVDDSCEDSSSLSSGISEAFDEISTDDLTGSSLSDHHVSTGGINAYCHPSSHKQQRPNATTVASRGNKVESGQQTVETAGLQQQQGHSRHKFSSSSSQQQQFGESSRKLSDQYDRQKIDVLLQKSRTNQRGRGCVDAIGQQSASSSQQHQGVRPKSEQMTTAMMMMNEIQLSADGQTLRVSASNFGYPQSPQHQNGAPPKRVPLATNSLKIMKTDFTGLSNHHHLHQLANGVGPNATMMGQSQQQHQQQQMMYGPSGYHSLDRKKHLLAYHDMDPSAARYYYSDAESMYVNYAMPRTSAGATLALVSPRRVPQMKRPDEVHQQQQQQQQQQAAQACWTRHSVAGHNKPNGTNGSNNNNNNNGQLSGTNGGSTIPSMSRSMIEPELLSKNGQKHKSSGTNEPSSNGGGGNSSATNGNHYQRVNGHARLSIPSQNVLQSGLMSSASISQSPRMARCTSTQSETGLRKEGAGGGAGEALSPSSQLYLHKLLANSPTSAAGVLGFPESGLPPSPGSLSERGLPSNLRPGHGPSPYAATMVGGTLLAPEEVHASSLSLASTSSSVYSTAEDKYQMEIRKLHRECETYRDKVQTLTTQQSTYAHVVAAFEQSLHSMTKRVQSLTMAGEQKDYELLDLKHKIDALYQMSLAAGLNVEQVLAPSPSLQRRHTFNNNGNGDAPGLARQISSESMHSTVSQRSSQSGGSSGPKSGNGSVSGSSKISLPPSSASPTNSAGGEKKPKKSWAPSMEVMQLRSSFSKAFGKNKGKGSPSKGANGSISDAEECTSGALARRHPSDSYPNTPVHQSKRNSNASGQLKPAGSLTCLDECDPADPVDQLKKQLADKDTKLTDVRLEALTSAHQVDQLKDAMNRMRAELAMVKNDNERLARILHSRTSRHGSQTSLPLLSDDNESVSEFGGHVNSDMSVPICVDATMGDNAKDGIRIRVSVSLDFSGEIVSDGSGSELLIGSLCLTTRVKWDLVDTFVCKLFKEYVLRIDPVSNLGLSAESIVGYQLGDCQRALGNEAGGAPNAVSLVNALQNGPSSLRIALRGLKQNNAVDSLAFETLMPKSLVQRYVDSLIQSRRIILCSLSGTGKSYLAKKLAEYLVTKNGKSFEEAVALFDGGNSSSSGSKAASDVKRFFQSMRKADSKSLPIVVILDNLHNMGSLNDLFTGLSDMPATFPYIIGTVHQSNHNATTLQLHHNFRWHPCANHTEPIKGFLGRYLRRRLIESEVKRGGKYPADLCKVLDWLPKVWIHLNKYLEVINSSEASIGSAQFMDCPLDMTQSRLWFIRLWNESLATYVREKANEGMHLYQKRASLEDPYEFVAQTWPWSNGESPEQVLTRIESSVGNNGGAGGDGTQSSRSSSSLNFDSLNGCGFRKNEYLLSDNDDPNDPDPLLLLMRLQEQAKSQKHNNGGSDFTTVDVPLRQQQHETKSATSRQLIQPNGGVESTF